MAARQFRKLPRRAQGRIDKVLELLGDNPRPPKAEALQGSLKGYLRVRTGEYRIIYCVLDKRLTVCILKIADRKEVYRKR